MHFASHSTASAMTDRFLFLSLRNAWQTLALAQTMLSGENVNKGEAGMHSEHATEHTRIEHIPLGLGEFRMNCRPVLARTNKCTG